MGTSFNDFEYGDMPSYPLLHVSFNLDLSVLKKLWSSAWLLMMWLLVQECPTVNLTQIFFMSKKIINYGKLLFQLINASNESWFVKEWFWHTFLLERPNCKYSDQNLVSTSPDNKLVSEGHRCPGTIVLEYLLFMSQTGAVDLSGKWVIDAP